MGAPRTLRTVLPILTLILVSAFLGWPQIGGASHDLGQDCYACHNIRSGQVWQGSYSVWSGKAIGMSTYGRAITCEVCHTNYGTGRFTASSASHHPVQVISGTSMATDNWTTTLVMCKDCHNADSVTLTPNLNPDLAPTNYLNIAGNTLLDGYPNHDVTSPDNQVNAGDSPHLLSMLLSAGQRTVSGSSVYNKVPSSAPATDYAFCFSCHDGSNNTSRGASDNILAAYVTKGHYFKSAAPTGGAINDRIPCSDCHASHNSVTNARLFEPDNTTWTGTRPTGLTMASETAPTAPETRAICIFCHEDYSAGNTTTTSKRVRTVQPIRRTYGVAGHAPTDTQSCNQCHNTHNPPAGGDDCLNCHRTGGSVLAKHQMTDLEFPADGTPGEDNAAIQVSGHKGVLYTTPYNTKALNECKKCHGTSHPTDAAKVQAADGTTTWPTGFVYGLSWSGSAWSANAASFLDTNANNIIDGNEFCLSCHDGNDALSPTDNANIRIGGVNPPVVWFPSGGQSTGHDRKSGSTYPVSGNAPAQQLCTSCHKYHTSDRPQLFPGNAGPFGAGSGYTYAMPTWAGIGTNWQAPRPATSVTPSSAGRMVIGTVNANLLNFTDRSLPSSGKGFGTAGAAAGTDGLCNACHRDAATVTAGTLNTAHTHEGNGVSPSKNTFVKDCVECHNPHGGGTTPNISMIRQTVGRDNTTQNAVVFSARTGANSFDELDGAVESNLDDLCATCHNGPSPIAHNYRVEATAGNHNQGSTCTTCHPHGQTDNAAKLGFPQASCNSCHGAPSDSTGMPAVGDNGVYHADANPVIGTRGGDNTAHKIHVAYLGNRRGITGASACYVCHKGGGGQEPHPGNLTNTTFKSGAQPSGDNVQVVIDNAWTIPGSGLNPSYSGTPGQAASQTNGWKTCGNTSCHYALSPSWSGKRQIANYLAVTDGANRTYPPLTGYGKGGDNVVVNQFRMATTAGTGATTATSIVLAGTNVSGNVAASGVRVYRDNGDNTFAAATDNAIGAAVSFAADNTATLSGLTEAVNETGANYWIVLTLAASPTNGATVNARVTTVSTPLAGGSQVSATNAPVGTTADTQLPTSAVTTSGYFTAVPVSIAGTASDNNSGVNHVDITIRNGATGNYWNGGAFGSAAPVWLAAAGSTSWSYSFSPPVDNTFLVQSRATDNVVYLQTVFGSGSFILDRVRPTVTSAVAQDNTHVLLTFSEALDNTAAGDNTYYAITGGAGLTVSAAARREAIDNASVLLTTSLQISGQPYTVAVDNVAPGVTDLAGNIVGNPGSANFSGYTANVINVTDGPNDPSATLFVRGGGSGTGRLVTQQFRMATSTGSASVTQIVVTKAGPATVPANGAYLFRDTGATAGQLDATDNQIVRMSFTGNTATFALTEPVTTAGNNYLVVVDIDNSATLDNQSLTTQVTSVTGTIAASNATTVSRSITMDKTLPTSTDNTTDPYILGTGPTDNVTLTGTAADTVSGVHHVDVAIQRVSDSQWWQGGAWGVTQQWIAATGTTSWSYTFAPGGDNTLNLQVRSTDNANDNTFTAGNGNLQSPVTTHNGILLDRVHPTVVSASAAVDNTHVTVVFSEQVDPTTSQVPGNYVITGGAGLTVSAAARQADNVTVILTTTAQTALTSYTVKVSNVTDRNGNLIGTPDNAVFTGYGLAFSSHTYWMFRPTTTQNIGADNVSPSAWTSGAAINTVPHNASMATTTATPAPGGRGTSVNYRNYYNGTGFVLMRFYIWDNLAAANAIQAGTVSGQAAMRASATTNQFWFSLWEYDPAGAAGNGTQIGANSNILTGFSTTTTNLAWTITIASNYTIPAGHRLELRCYGTSTGATSTTNNRIYFGATTAGLTSTSFTISESTTQANLAPPRETGDTTGISCNTCHQFGPDDATAGFRSVNGFNQYYYARPGSHAVHGAMGLDNGNPVATQALDSCTICHPSNANAYGFDHASGAVNTRTGSIGTRTAGPAYADDGTYDNGTRTCSNVYCHAGRPTPQATGQSWGYGTAVCGTCHAVTPPFGKHAIHNNGNIATTPTETSTAGNYDYSCYYCHPSGAAHVNYPVSAVQAAQVSFSGTLGDNTLSGTYTPGVTTVGWDNVTNQGLSWTNGSCATYCHTNGQGGPALVTPTWNHAGFPTATCVGCHDTRGASTALSTRHRKHTDNTAATGYNYSCDECHAATVANDSWTTLHATTGRPNHVDGIRTVQFGTTLRATAVAISGSYTQGVDNCSNTYCHSDGSSIKNSGTIQANSIRWDNTTSPLPCNSCHGIGGLSSGAPNYTTSGTRRNSHPAHAAFGCETCHSLTTTTGNSITTASNHVNGTYQVSGAGFTYSNTTMLTTGSTCAFTSGCHTGTVTWGTTLSGGCFSCHAGTEQIYKPQNDYGTPGTANPVDNTQYLTRGHGRPQASGGYAATNNPAAHMDNVSGAPSDCYYCHSQTAGHIPTDNVNDPFRLGYGTDTTGQKGSVSLQGAYADSINLLCLKCHGNAADRSGVAEAATVAINMQTHAYGITGTTYATWPVTPWKCIDCHDPHGDANNAMIRGGINAPNSGSDTLAGSDAKGRPQRTGADVHAITFTDNSGYATASYAVPGAGSWGICEVCHTRTAAYAATGAGTDNAGTHAARTGNCSACHSHTQGFKGACNICHSHPGQDNTTSPKQMSSGHRDHVGVPGVGGEANSRNFPCEACHFNYIPVHNQSGYAPGQAWSAPAYYANVSIRFDNAWNPGAVTYAGAPAGTATAPGVGGTGVCAGLYCHGGNAALNAGWNGSGTSPRWDNAAYACGACHDTGTSDTTTATRMSTGNHPAHIDNAWGPGIGAFSAGGNCAEGAGCHTAYGLTPTSTHANNQVNLRTSPTDNTPTVLSGTQVCRNCHSTYTSGVNLPTPGDTLVRIQANWDNAAYKVGCITCHNDASDASAFPVSQGRQNMDGSGAIAPNAMAAYYTNGHGAASIDNASTTGDTGAVDRVAPVRCDACHNELAAHIGAAKDTTNPYRLDNAVVNFTQTGAVDQWCLGQCHTTTPLNHPARHAWRVNGSGAAAAQTKDNTVHTHPTTMQVVPQSGAPSGETVNKDRWFRIPAAALPVQADLLTKTPAARTTGSLLVCVTCHDPHGVPASPIARRSFSGASDNGFQMLRYKSGNLMALCEQCHS